MANEEVLGPRKTMFVLVIVVGCFAVLWPRILSPLILGHTREQLKPNQFDRDAAVKQERPAARVGPHPALRERGRAIPAGAPPAPKPVSMPPHVRVRSSPLSGYFELDVKPPPIPGMRPPLGSPGGPVTAPKSSMGFVMPIYTICIIVFFVYTLSKILFKRTGPSPYETITPDPQFRRRVFRDDSRTSPDKLGPKERDTIVTAISGLVAEVQQQMDASYAQSQQRQDAQDSARPYTNGTILHNSGPVHIVTSEYQDTSKEKSPDVKESTPEPKESVPESKELSPEPKESTPEPEKAIETKESTPEPKESILESEPNPETIELSSEPKQLSSEPKESIPESETTQEINESTPEPVESIREPKESTPETKEPTPEIDIEATVDNTEEEEEPEPEVNDLVKLTDNIEVEKNRDVLSKSTEEFLREESNILASEKTVEEKQSTPELLEEAIKEDSEDEVDQDNASVKVVGMEITAHSADGSSYRAPLPAVPQPAAPTRPAHEAEQVQSIYLETEIPQKSRVLVTEFAEDKIDKPTPARNSPMVVSGKMTLSLIQDAPRDTPEREQEPESTIDDFTTASAVTQNAAEKEDDLSDDEEIEEEIEVEEIEEIEEEVSEEDVEVEEVEESDEEEPKKKVQEKTGPGKE